MAKHLLRALLLVGAAFGLASEPVAAKEDPIYTGTFSNTAVGGFDPVAYFTDGKPVEGKKEFSTKWMGADWRFASAENLAKFQAAPEKYAPQYGGYCAWAVSQGYTASGDPKYWAVVDGKLYLNYDAKVQKTWDADRPGFIARADGNWPKVLN